MWTCACVYIRGLPSHSRCDFVFRSRKQLKTKKWNKQKQRLSRNAPLCVPTLTVENIPVRPLSLIKTCFSSCVEFWGDVGKEFFWKTKHTGKFLDYNFDVTQGEIYIKCMEGATTNICYNVLDRNVHERKLGDKVAFYWSVYVICFNHSLHDPPPPQLDKDLCLVRIYFHLHIPIIYLISFFRISVTCTLGWR